MKKFISWYALIPIYRKVAIAQILIGLGLPIQDLFRLSGQEIYLVAYDTYLISVSSIFLGIWLLLIKERSDFPPLFVFLAFPLFTYSFAIFPFYAYVAPQLTNVIFDQFLGSVSYSVKPVISVSPMILIWLLFDVLSSYLWREDHYGVHR